LEDDKIIGYQKNIYIFTVGEYIFKSLITLIISQKYISHNKYLSGRFMAVLSFRAKLLEKKKLEA